MRYFPKLLLIFVVVKSLYGNEAVYWKLVTPKIQLHSAVILECNHECCSRNSSTYWKIENGSSTLATQYPFKYTIWSSTRSCRLEIHNFIVEDANINYTCFHTFKSFSRNLKLGVDNFIQLPSRKDIITSLDAEQQTFNIRLRNTYPAVKCFAHNNNTSVHVAKYTKMIGMLFSSNIKVRIPESKGLFIINCRVKNTEIFRYMIFTQQISNGSRVDVLSKETDNCKVIAGIATVLLFVCLLSYSLHSLWNCTKRKHSHLYSEQKLSVQNYGKPLLNNNKVPPNNINSLNVNETKQT